MANIREVAGRAGVSPTTVSHVVNATRFVSHEIRARVMEAMTELGYHPNAVARSLRRGRTHTLGLVLPDSANPYFAELGRGIETAAFGRNYSVVLCNTEGEELRERVYVDLLTRRQVDGLLYVPAGSRVDVLRDLLRQALPVVLVDRDLPGAPIDVVLSDKRGGAYLATRHLIALGHRRIGCIGGPSSLLMSGQRLQGYRDALAEADLPIDESLVLRGDYHPQSGWAAARSLLASPVPPTAIFAANDLMAIGVLRAAGELGRRVPDDLAVVGFDDIELASYTTPPLTTVSQSASEVGRAAVELLLQRLADPARPPVRRTLETRLVVRASCGNHA
jgi:LacI family transcriptional regulator, galactose operon repressor